VKKALINEVKGLVKEGKYQEALNKFYNELDMNTIECFEIMNGQIIKEIFEESELVIENEERNITSFNQLEDNNFYTVSDNDHYGENGIIVYEIGKDLIDSLLEVVA
jgi:hypothetical protein